MKRSLNRLSPIDKVRGVYEIAVCVGYYVELRAIKKAALLKILEPRIAVDYVARYGAENPWPIAPGVIQTDQWGKFCAIAIWLHPLFYLHEGS